MIGTMPTNPLRAVLSLSLCLLLGVAQAQISTETGDSYDPDPPERAARLSLIEGDVSLQPAGEQEWAPAILNRPLTTGDKLWTERNARAEIHVGPAAVRLSSDTGFSFLNVDDNTIQMRMTAGVMSLSVRALRDNEQIEIATPNVALSLLRPGNYRVEVNDAGDRTVVKVSEGALQATGGDQDLVVHSRQVVTFTGVETLATNFGTPGELDEFDSWTLDRERRDQQAASSRTAQYVAPEVTGYEDLDDHGDWSSDAEYGYVWTPRNVAVDWAPYRYGRWVWVSPWGYTWIDDARWGYAPFHYGRWAHVRNRWCWVPGPRHMRAVYAPALVGWVGTPGLSVSWFPLGPREVYRPYRRHSHRYFDRVNHANTVIERRHMQEVYANRARQVYRNLNSPRAVTAVSRDAFTSARRTGEHRLRDQENTRGRSASAQPPQIEPGRESRLGGPRRTNVRLPPQSIENRQVVVRRAPPASAARFARNADVGRSQVRDADRNTRPSVRSDVDRNAAAAAAFRGRDRNERPQNQDRPERVDRQDRPVRTERPETESTPPARSSVFDRHALSERVREDRDRQVRADQQQRDNVRRYETEQRESGNRQRWQRPDDQPREQARAAREPQQDRERSNRQMDAMRESAIRQSREREQSRQRENPRPQMEQRREQPREERRMEQPREQRQERPARAERQSQPEPRSQPGRRDDGGGGSRPRRE
jgi:hypothetical protein